MVSNNDCVRNIFFRMSRWCQALTVCETNIFCVRHSVQNELCENIQFRGSTCWQVLILRESFFSKVAMVPQIACLRNRYFSKSPCCRRVTGSMLLASGYWLKVAGSRLPGPGYWLQPYRFQTTGSRSLVPDHWFQITGIRAVVPEH